jgi:hypothetical protein
LAEPELDLALEGRLSHSCDEIRPSGRIRMVDTLLTLIARLWAFLRDLGSVVKACRFSAFVVLAGGALLLAIPQGRELTVRLADQGSFWKVLLFYVCVFVWAFQSWYWARFILDAVFGIDRQVDAASHPRSIRIGFLINHLPRVIALLAYAVAVLACWAARKQIGLWIGFGLLVQGIVFYFLLVRRSGWTAYLVKRYPGKVRQMLARADPQSPTLQALAPLSRWIFFATLVAALCAVAWAWADPVGLGWFFGSSAVVFLAFAMIVPVGSLAVYYSRRGGRARLEEEAKHPVPVWRVQGYPVLAVALLSASLFSIWLDNHAVRRLDGSPPHTGRSMPDVVDRWLSQAPRNADGSVNVVVVATAGGGIRAAYWTATVLGSIQDRMPSFRNQLLGISGVSGGSLGATVFATLLSRQQLPASPQSCDHQSARRQPTISWTRGRYECLGQGVLAQDFLAPAVAGALFTDLIQRFVPFSFLPDRARALEQGWERGWPRAGFERDVWSEHGFDALWPQQGHLPALLLNGTHVETGRRIITSNIVIEPGAFPDAYDFFKLRGDQIRPSTAALNSARFTYVSPAGSLGARGRIVDGGYFENFGADTARDLLQAALRRLKDRGVNAHPILILISNDPGLNDEELPRTSGAAGRSNGGSNGGPAPAGGSGWSGELLSPVRALLHTREAHGTLATFDAAGLLDGSDSLFHFRLCHDRTAPDPALGWVLSDDSEALIREQLHTHDCTGAAQFDRLTKRLAEANSAPSP